MLGEYLLFYFLICPYRSGVGYQCLGYATEFTKCMRVLNEVKRKPFKVPDELKEKYDFLYVYVLFSCLLIILL